MRAAADHDTGVQVGRVRDAAEYLEIEQVYRQVFDVPAGGGSINARLLTAIDRNSGIVVVARDADRLLGFACSFLSRDAAGGRLYQYSQTAAVVPEAQGRGIGRALKFAQREQALAGGVDLMRWAFDPLQARNAHVNLDVLGGRVRTFVRDLYAGAAPGRDSGDRTDRFVVDWELAVAPAPPFPSALPPPPPVGETVRVGPVALVSVPAAWDRTRAELGWEAALALRERIAIVFDRLLAAGLVAVACRRVDATTAAYVFRDEADLESGR